MGTVSDQVCANRQCGGGALFKGKPEAFDVQGRIHGEDGDVQTFLRRLNVERELGIIPDHLDDALGEPVAVNRVRYGPAKGVMTQGQLHVQVCGRFLEARDVIVQPENSRSGRRVVKADDLEDRGARAKLWLIM